MNKELEQTIDAHISALKEIERLEKFIASHAFFFAIFGILKRPFGGGK